MSTANRVFRIATEFSNTPGPRFIDEGDFSGEDLRARLIEPLVQKAIAENIRVLVDLDGTHGYLTSFLEEAFGGLIRINRIPFETLKSLLSFKSSEEPYLIEDIEDYLKEAQDETF